MTPHTAKQPPAEAHCATCACVPGMTPAIRFDATAAEKEGAVREQLIRMGWTPPAEAQAQGGAPDVAAAEAMGAKGGPASEPERLAFEAWMRGHCWALFATWGGTTYTSDAEQGGGYCEKAAMTRMRWAAWRDRAALASAPPSAPVGGVAWRDAWRDAFIAERARRYRSEGMKIEQARIHAEADADLAISPHSQQPANASDLQSEVFKFAEATFGPGREDAAWKKLFEELGEVLKSPRAPEEWGDVFILLFDLATIYGVRVDEATRSKLDIIRNRVWAKTETGTFQHIPGMTETKNESPEPTPVPRFSCLLEGGPLAGQELILEGHAQAWAPPDWTGSGAYTLERQDRGLDGRTLYVYRWDSGVEVVL